MSKSTLIAFYLPQFYPTPENDEWWAKGFTEWTNVGRAKPLFRGHYQPKVPADLGYYDLRISEVREQQAKLALKAGISGFCYWHYWFSGRRLLDKVFNEVVTSGSPDFPFCLCWANHSWYQKTWDPNKPNKLLIEQEYPGINDYKEHFYAMLPAFKDSRYIKHNGRLLFGIYSPLSIPDLNLFIDTWNDLAKQNGLEGFCFFAYCNNSDNIFEIKKSNYDLIVFDGIMQLWQDEKGLKHLYNGIKRKLFHIPRLFNYKDYARRYEHILNENPLLIPCVVPNFDHSPRSADRGVIMVDSTPQNFGRLLFDVLKRSSSLDQNIVFIKAWNEWGEGNYMEPDIKYGRGYIDECRKAIESCF